MRHQPNARISPIGVMLCLLAYLLSATPLLPVATAVIAWLDGEHHVTLAMEKDGVSVVLGHDERDARKSLTHTHCIVSSALTLLAEPAGPAHSDHVLNFQAGNVATPGKAVAHLPAPIASETSTIPVSIAERVLPVIVTKVEAPLLDIPPPATSVTVARATVLLI